MDSFLTLSRAAAEVAAGRLSADALWDDLDARADRLEPRLNCFITRCRERPAAAPGPLQGLPLAVKDNVETAGVRSTGGSTILSDYVPRDDAPAWARLRAAGARLQGKTNLHELGMGATNINPHYGPT